MGIRTPFLIALAILAIAAASITGAFIFQALGYAPCELCLKERIPYYAAIPIAVLTLFFAARSSKTLMRAGFVVLALIFAASAVLGAYHAGVEWGFWAGPTECTGALDRAASVSDFLKQLETVKVVRCDSAALRILGLSLAGWNAVISAGLVTIAALGLRAKP
ncbi:MAG: disulfide bond formation protein B [Methylocella sp.]|jgi:disulfide bond formation protein DsbB